MTTILARLGCSVSLPRMTFTVYDAEGEVITGALVDSVAIVEFSSPYSTAPTLVIRSDETPVAPASVEWDDTAQTLDVHLSPDQVDAVGAGSWTVVAKIEEPADVPGEEDVLHDVRSMTLAMTVERWPIAVE